MIKINTILKVSDNSSIKTVKCIKILGGYKKKYAEIGDIIVVTVKEIRFCNLKKSFKIKKKDIFKALVIRTKNFVDKRSNIKIFFKFNSVILLDKLKNPVGTRIFGYLPRILKLNYNKCISIASKKIRRYSLNFW
jgi:large subunit ribosomal protein L14